MMIYHPKSKSFVIVQQAEQKYGKKMKNSTHT
jgi:hypothetical protein